MAGADYYSCDICRHKTFYHASVNYLKDVMNDPEEQGIDIDFDNEDEYYLDLPFGVGDMKVICERCAETHEVVIREIKHD